MVGLVSEAREVESSEFTALAAMIACFLSDEIGGFVWGDICGRQAGTASLRCCCRYAVELQLGSCAWRGMLWPSR
jgi:hypothetical protein